MKILQILSRVLLGVVFTLSGIAKAIDPVGSEIKFTEYFNALGMPSLGVISLFLAILLSSIEFLVGFCLVFNVKTKLSSLGAVIFMVIFTPLTLWIAITNPVTDCGCFGDFLKISNWATFWKNVFFITIAIFLFYKVRSENLNRNKKSELIFIGISIIFIFSFQIYNVRHLPVVDFRPYSVGTYLPDQMIIPENAKKDSSITYLYYSKDGETKKYLMDDIPWQDTTWIWQKTETEVVEKGYEPPIHDFSMFSFNVHSENQSSSINILDEVLADESYSFLLISNNLVVTRFTDYDAIEILKSNSLKLNYNIYFLTSSTGEDIGFFNKRLPLNIDFYITDVLTLKTMIRSNPGLILLKGGRVIEKWHHNDFPSINEVKEIIKN